MLALEIRRRSSPLSAIHLASTSSESGQPGAAVGLGLVRELDAVLVEQAAGLRQVGHDRLVRVDQVRVRDAAQLLVQRLAAPDPDQPQVAVHLPLLVVHARLQELAGALLGAALAAGVVRVDVARCARGLAGARGAPGGARTYGSMTSHRSAMTTIAVAQRATVTARCLLRSARCAREEDDPAGGARDVLERAHHLGLPPAALASRPGSRPTSPARAGAGTPRRAAARPRRPRCRPRRSAARHIPDACAGTSWPHYVTRAAARAVVAPVGPSADCAHARARSPGPAPGRCRAARRAPPPTRAAAPPARPPAG